MRGPATALHRPLAQQAAGALGELRARRPPDVVALRALVESGAPLVLADGAAVATVQALHLAEANLHEGEIGLLSNSPVPRMGDWENRPVCVRADALRSAARPS